MCHEKIQGASAGCSHLLDTDECFPGKVDQQQLHGVAAGRRHSVGPEDYPADAANPMLAGRCHFVYT